MQFDLKKAIKKVFDNKKIIENYFFMTILQVLNSFFYLLIYPYVLRVLGTDKYGVFIFATAIASYFTFVVNFGFDLPAVKAVAINAENKRELEKILSYVFTAKSYLFIGSAALFAVMLFLIPVFAMHQSVFLACFLLIFSSVLLPQWFFQGIQEMKIITVLQLGAKLISLPFIFVFVKEKQDLVIYSWIVSGSALLGAAIGFALLIYKYEMSIQWMRIKTLKSVFTDSLPFFYSSLASVLKEYTVPIIIGSFFNMRDVAIYDLANKIIMVPRTIFMSVNSAIFPKIVSNPKKDLIKKIIKIESLAAVVSIILIVIFGQTAVRLLAGAEIIDAYHMACLLAVTIVSWLIVGAYINFVFIPNNMYYLVSTNQIVALLSFLLYTIVGLSIYKNILVFGCALALAGITEIVYCNVISKKYRLL